MLSDQDLRSAYDKYGKESARPSEGFVDPAEFFTSIFGGEAFADWIGEISLMKDLTATMDIATIAAEEEEAAAAAEAEAAGTAGAAGSSKDAEFPGTEEAMKESMKAAEGARSSTEKTPIPTVVVEDEKPAKSDKSGHNHYSGGVADAPPPYTKSPSPGPGSGANTPGNSRTQIPIRPALMDRPASDDAAHDETAGGADGKHKDKKGKSGMSKEQREKLAAYEKERAKIRLERVDTLARKLLDRLSVWTETDRDKDVTAAFQEKTRLEVEELKMESFGIDILHAIGATYVSKATALLRSQKFFGMGGFLSRMKDKGTLVKDTWNTISSAIDAQQTMEEMARLEQQGGEEWTDEKKIEYERRVTGKILTAAWRGSRFEIQSVLRDVCDAVLNDKKVALAKRLQRAEGLILIGQICSNVSVLFVLSHSPPALSPPLMNEWQLTLFFLQAKRSPEEEGDYMAFEQLVAEAALKKEKEKEHKKKGKDKKDKDKDKDDGKFGDKGWASAASAAAGDVPNVPKGSSP